MSYQPLCAPTGSGPASRSVDVLLRSSAVARATSKHASATLSEVAGTRKLLADYRTRLRQLLDEQD
jgi:hypothetical protein